MEKVNWSKINKIYIEYDKKDEAQWDDMKWVTKLPTKNLEKICKGSVTQM